MTDKIRISKTSDKDYPVLVETNGRGETLLDRDGAGKIIIIAGKLLGVSVQSVCRGLADGKAIEVEDKHGLLRRKG